MLALPKYRNKVYSTRDGEGEVANIVIDYRGRVGWLVRKGDLNTVTFGFEGKEVGHQHWLSADGSCRYKCIGIYDKALLNLENV